MGADRDHSLVGTELGRYRVRSRLGAGGMGEVFVAEDPSLKRKVALKVLPAELAADRERLDRFQREAEAVAALNHPSIVTIHSVEQAGDTRFITMELVEGATLAEVIPDRGMELGRFFPIAVALADALAAAHAKGVVHRDLKPANVMVTDDGRIKILDFGLAKLTAEPAAPDLSLLATEPLTREGMAMGTMPYMSPEQVLGRPVDSRTDVFSLGVVLYEMLRGRRPFGGDSAVELTSSILRDAPPQLRESRADLPRHLDRIVQHCLEKDPERRFQSALDVRNELQALDSELSSEAAAPAAASPAVPVARRAPLRIAGGAVIVLLAVAAGLWLSRRPPAGPPPSADRAAPSRQMVVVLPFENLGAAEDQYFAGGITEEITTRLASVSGLGVISRNSADRYAGTDKSIGEIGQELGVGYVLAGTVRWARSEAGSRVRITPRLIRVADDLQLWSDIYDHVLEDVFEVQSAIAGRVIEQLGVTLVDRERVALEASPTANMQAYQAYLRGLDKTGRLTYSREDRLLEVQMFERAVELDPGFALAWAELSRAHSNLINLGMDKSPERLAAAGAAVERALALDPELGEAHLAEAYYHYWGRRDYARALSALAVAERQLPNSGDVLAAKAWIARRQGRWQDSLRFAEEASRLDPLSSQLATEIAVIRLSTRRFERALESLERSIALSPDQQTAYLLTGLVHWGRGDLDAARTALAVVPGARTPLSNWFAVFQALYEDDWDAAEAAIRELPEEPVVVVPAVMLCREQLLGDLERFRGKPDRARRHWQRARPLLEKQLASAPDDARVHAILGRLLAGLGLEEQAIASGRRAVELYPVSKDALHGPRQHIELAIIYGWVGEPGLAVEQLELMLAEETWLTGAILQRDPYFDPLRGHPAFEALLASQP